MAEVLEELLLGSSAVRFLDDSWARVDRHLVAEHGPGRLRDLARLDVFASRSALEAIHRGRVVAQGRDVDGRHAGHLLTAEEIDGYLQRRYTIIFERLHDWIPELALICRDLAASVGFPERLICCNLFLTPPGGGIIKHFDNQDVWVVGLRGTKRFTIAPNDEIRYPSANSVSESPDWRESHSAGFAEHMPPDATTVDLCRGIALYMPPGYWHMTASEEGAWSLSFGLRRPSWRELFVDLLSVQMTGDRRWTARVAGLIGADGVTSAARERLAALEQALRECTAEQLWQARNLR